MRLIDADALFTELNEKDIPWDRRINDIIMKQQTAYDVDKVVEQLEELRDRGNKTGILHFGDIIKIVKGGGVNE